VSWKVGGEAGLRGHELGRGDKEKRAPGFKLGKCCAAAAFAKGVRFDSSQEKFKVPSLAMGRPRSGTPRGDALCSFLPGHSIRVQEDD